MAPLPKAPAGLGDGRASTRLACGGGPGGGAQLGQGPVGSLVLPLTCVGHGQVSGMAFEARRSCFLDVKPALGTGHWSAPPPLLPTTTRGCDWSPSMCLTTLSV